MTDAPPPAGPRTTLDELCDLLGVQRRHEAGGAWHEAPEASVRAVLRELGAPLEGDGPGALEDALRAVRAGRWERVLEPVSVAWEGERPALTLRLPRAEAESSLELRVALEDGGVAERRVEAGEIVWEEEVGVDGRAFGRGTLALPDLPAGWHDVTLRTRAREASTRLIRAPRSTWDGPAESAGAAAAGGPAAPPDAPADAPGWRAWGAFLPLHALRTARDRGVGDLGDLERLARWTRDRGGAFVGTLPLLAAFLGDGHGPGSAGDAAGPFEPSPYAPVSRLFWNELHLDLERAPGLEAAPDARRVLESADHRAEARRLRAGDRVDHRTAMAHKRRVLEPLARAVAGPGDAAGLAGPLGRFAGERPDALDYARFRAYGEAAGGPWPTWPGPAAAGALEAGAIPDDRVRYHLYVQWAMEQQLARLTDPGRSDVASLYLDLPLGSHPRGYDVWRHRDAFATGASGGAPPDAFFAGGQDWGFPPLHPIRSRESGHDYFAASLRHLMGVAGILRVDHVMSLHRLFWVPAGGGAADGVYVRYPSGELWAALCLESRRYRCEVVGEDLGTVPPEVPREMERRGARRMWVLPFEVGTGAPGEREAAAPATRSVAYVDTHDLPPFASFWRGLDIERRVEGGHLDAGGAEDERRARRRWRRAVGDWLGGVDGDDPPGDVLGRVLARLAGSPARLLLLNLEDLWLEERPQNVPGTAGPGNWTLRAARTLEELAADPAIEAVLRRVDETRRAPSDEGDR